MHGVHGFRLGGADPPDNQRYEPVQVELTNNNDAPAGGRKPFQNAKDSLASASILEKSKASVNQQSTGQHERQIIE